MQSAVVLWTLGWAVVAVLAVVLRRWLVTRLATGVVTLPPPPLGHWLPTQDAVAPVLGPWLPHVGVPPLSLGVWLPIDWSQGSPAQIPVIQGAADED
ncbi:hypothetical protein SE18_23595 [Herpetosiphon geysericola]|uniref:Uncharacterized protein n=1 Tax=Herpetosiphon geysericola TaxID=70996 RepID=A0A0P6Y5K2_9CHLR|nr:hypothetical protein SE18_23595 [Herpetosiphon geysericola]